MTSTAPASATKSEGSPGSRLLIVTPTLGTSEFLDQTMATVRALPLAVTHVLSCPKPKIEELRARYPECLVVADAGREGAIYGALNTGLDAVPEGWDWFTYINDDDELTPGFGEVAREHFARSQPEAVTYGDVRLIDERGDSIGYLTTERTLSYFPALLHQGISPLNQQGMLFRADVVRALRGFDLRYRLCADLDFWLRAFARGDAFRYYPREVARFRIRQGQLSGNVSLTATELQEIVDRHLPQPVTSTQLLWAKWRYRFCNLPRYLERSRVMGWSTSNVFLAGGGRRAA